LKAIQRELVSIGETFLQALMSERDACGRTGVRETSALTPALSPRSGSPVDRVSVGSEPIFAARIILGTIGRAQRGLRRRHCAQNAATELPFHEPPLPIPLLRSERRRGCPKGGRGGARVHGPNARPKLEVEATHEPACSAGWQPALSPTGSRQRVGHAERPQIANLRHSRLPVCATGPRRFRGARRGYSSASSLLGERAGVRAGQASIRLETQAGCWTAPQGQSRFLHAHSCTQVGSGATFAPHA
jgi:hypothetical protein